MKQIALLLVIGLMCSAFSAIQVEMKGSDVFGEKIPGDGKYGSNAGAFTTNIDAQFKLSPNLDLLLIENFDGVLRLAYDKPGVLEPKKVSPFSEKTLPSSNNLSVGLRFTGLGDLRLIAKNMWYPDALPLYPEFAHVNNYVILDSNSYMHTDDKMTRKMRNNINGYWSIPINNFTITTDLNYFGMLYNIEPHGINSSNYQDTAFGSWNTSYNDMWSRFNVAYQLTTEISVSGEALLKNDLKNKLLGFNFTGDSMNVYREALEVRGIHDLPFDNKLVWSVDGRWYQSGTMEAKEFTTGPGAIIYARDVWSIDNGLFLKGAMSLEMGERKLFKPRYEISIRKAWDNETSVELGYVTNQGGLFPTQANYIRSKVHLTPEFSVSPNVKAVWEGPDKKILSNDDGSDKGIVFMKATANLELAYAIVNHFEILGGVDYTYYNAVALVEGGYFPSRLGMYLGLRTWI